METMGNNSIQHLTLGTEIQETEESNLNFNTENSKKQAPRKIVKPAPRINTHYTKINLAKF